MRLTSVIGRAGFGRLIACCFVGETAATVLFVAAPKPFNEIR